MTRIHRFVATLALAAGLAVPVVARANDHVRVPEDIDPNFYTSAPLESLTDGEWTAIPFFRPPECIRADFNILRYFDAAALLCPLLVEGFAEFNDVGPILSSLHGRGAVPIWFVRAAELAAATADRVVTIGELGALPSLQKGVAGFYNEQNHIFGVHQVSHFTLVARGALDDGRAFEVGVIEVDLELVRAIIEFE
ncbi:MAG TPA: hypothetical protein VFD06_05655 [Candidatus Polarisedimenticolia bacterium]|nr:hypothetical protein [Candidatus Polarisedimenticolia bacterium]